MMLASRIFTPAMEIYITIMVWIVLNKTQAQNAQLCSPHITLLALDLR